MRPTIRMLMTITMLAASCGDNAPPEVQPQPPSAAVPGYTCGSGDKTQFQDPEGTYTFSGMPMPGGGVWSGSAIIVADSIGTPGALYVGIDTPQGQLQCTSMWHGVSFMIICPKTSSTASEVWIEGVQTNNGHSATLNATVSGTNLSTPHFGFGFITFTSTSITWNKKITGHGFPCAANPPIPTGNKTYNWQMANGTWYQGAMTLGVNGSGYYDWTFANPNGYTDWQGQGVGILDENDVMNIWLWGIAEPTTQSCPWGSGGECEPAWFTKQWVFPYTWGKYQYSPNQYSTGQFFDVF